nr:BamA/TamA family outer membrane protein [Moheibacter lacus]
MIVYSCNVTKKVPEGQHLLTKNEFKFEEKEKPFKSNLPDYVKQKPNGGALFGLFPLKLLLYNSVPAKFDTTFAEYYDLTKKRRTQESLDSLLQKNGLEEYTGNSLWLKRFRYNQGEPPVLIDTAMSAFSEENLENYYFDRGYFDAEVKSEHDLDSAAKKGEVIYNIQPGEVSIIESYAHIIKDTALLRQYENLVKRGSDIKVGERYDMDNFMSERDKIEEYFKNRGYWKFNEDGQAVEFTADTTLSDKQLAITLLIPKGADKDSIRVKEKFAKYRYGEIHLYPDSDPVPQDKEPPVYYDTIYEGYHLHYVDPKMKYRPKFFTDAMVVRDSSLYRFISESQTKRNFSKREGINLTSFSYKWDEQNAELIRNDSILDVDLYFRAKKKYDIYYGAELSWSEFMNFGISPRVSLVARNLFGGGENLETTVRGTLGNVNKKFTDEGSFFNAFELAFQSKIGFPYLLFPLKVDNLFSKRFYKQTDFRIGTSVQRNIGLGRVTYSTGLDYNISYRDTHSHMLSVLNTEFVNNLQKENYFNVFEGDKNIKNNFFNQYYFMYNPAAAIQHYNGELSDIDVIEMIYDDQAFLTSLDEDGLESLSIFENMNFRRQTITQDVLITSLIYQYTWDQSQRRNVKNPWLFKGRVETSGNILSLLDNAFGFYQTENEQGDESGMVFNVPYSQFVKLDVDIRKYFNINSKSTLATRALFGFIQPYGNTDFIPFSRSYTAGGANDVRGWTAATLGPADFPRYAGGDDVFAIERLKLLFNVEYRFKMTDLFHGAFFVDAGNIWGTDKDNELTLFRFKDFYKELGIGSGFGLRLDLTYLIIRLDLAYKIHDPSYPLGDRWQFDNLNILKPRLAFGINYPF